MNQVEERIRFNALSQEEAKALLAAAEGVTADFRSCWNCNSAHDHLKDRVVLMCFACGIHYLKGYPAPVVCSRAEGKDITEEDMQRFAECLENAE